MTKHLLEKIHEALDLAKSLSKDGNFSLCSVARILSRQGYEVTGNFIGGILSDTAFIINDIKFEFELDGEAYDPFEIFGHWKLKTNTQGETHGHSSQQGL